jgi:hypothetical protein
MVRVRREIEREEAKEEEVSETGTTVDIAHSFQGKRVAHTLLHQTA